MAKIVIDCADPNDFAAVVESAENAAGSCTVTYAKQHLEMQKSGTSQSQRESARIIAKDSGESEGAVRRKIQRGLQEVAHDVPSERGYANQVRCSVCELNWVSPNGKGICRSCRKRIKEREKVQKAKEEFEQIPVDLEADRRCKEFAEKLSQISDEFANHEIGKISEETLTILGGASSYINTIYNEIAKESLFIIP
jgi:hypothetical protein